MITNTTATKTNTKSVFRKAPFRVLVTLLIIEGVMIGQVLSRPGEAKEPVGKTETYRDRRAGEPNGRTARRLLTLWLS